MRAPGNGAGDRGVCWGPFDMFASTSSAQAGQAGQGVGVRALETVPDTVFSPEHPDFSPRDHGDCHNL